jgi:hypothetical protein
MKIIKIESSNHKMLNPKTGEIIIDEEGLKESPSLIAYWVDEVIREPGIYNDELKQTWKDFVIKYEEEEDDFPDFEALYSFLEKYESADWIVYEITLSGIACGPYSTTAWHVVNKDVVVEEI